MNDEKKWYHSKTMVFNLLSIGLIIFQSVTKQYAIVGVDTQATIIAIINVLLRSQSNEPSDPIERSLI